MKSKAVAVRLSACLLVAVLFTTGLAMAQERNVWFPYCNNNKAGYDSEGSWWGGYGNDMMYQIGVGPNPIPPYTGFHMLTTPNVIWNNDRVFYYESGTSAYKSWYQNQGGERAWQVYITNPTATNYTLSGGVDSRIKLYMYGNDGVLMNELTTWSDGTTLFLKTANNPGPDIEWIAAEDCFAVSVPAGYTTVLGNFGNAGQNEILVTPALPTNGQASMRLCQPQGGRFNATMHGQQRGHWRKYEGSTSTAFSSEWEMGVFRYDGVDMTNYGTYNCLELPYSRETWNPNGVGDWSTAISLVNAQAESDELLIQVLRLNNTLVSQTVLELDPYQRVVFAPSQLSRVASDNVVKVRIYGETPVAAATITRWPPSNSQILGDDGVYYKTHLEAGSMSNLVLTPNPWE